jgi:hypothetical protein
MCRVTFLFVYFAVGYVCWLLTRHYRAYLKLRHRWYAAGEFMVNRRAGNGRSPYAYYDRCAGNVSFASSIRSFLLQPEQGEPRL